MINLTIRWDILESCLIFDMDKIVVTTDFSTASKAGIRFAIQLQLQANFELTFYHAIEILKPTSWSDEKYKKFAAETIAEKKEKLIAFASQICKESGHTSTTHRYFVEIGTKVSDQVINHAKNIKAAFICMSTTGAGTFGKLFGTNASSLIFASTIPLLVVPKSYRTTAISSLFYASDFSSLTTELKKVQAFAENVDAKIEVYHYGYLLDLPENKNKFIKKAEGFKSASTTFSFIKQEVDDTLSECLAKDIQKLKPSILVLFTKQNRGWFDRLFPSGISADVAFKAKVPMLIFQKSK